MTYSNLSAYLALERYEETLDALDEVERSTPDDPENVRSRGVIDACAGRISEALATFEELVRRWPRQARRFEAQNALRQPRHIERGETPPGDYLVDHLQEQNVAEAIEADLQAAEKQARQPEPNRRGRQLFSWGAPWVHPRV
jgi:tetratricopeptide (TPR) repeat protein